MRPEMNRLSIIVPVKSPRLGKSRLGAVLRRHRRHKLNLGLFKRTLNEAGKLASIADVMVVSKSPKVLEQAVQVGFKGCLEPADCDLNEAIAIGAEAAKKAGATEVMVLPIDLPWLSADRLQQVIVEFRNACDVMIITDFAGRGTNLLLWRPIGMSVFQFGEGSAKRHAEAARSLGLRVSVLKDPMLSFDLDTPGDLDVWSRGKPAFMSRFA
jgi:2-phospho-L-lactate guanylyltransferase